MFTLSAGILVAAAMSLGAYTGQSAAQTTGPIEAIAAGDQHALAIADFSSGSGLVWGWGANWNGQVGDGAHYYSRFPPTQVMAGSGPGDFTSATAIDGGENFSLAARNDGTVWAWGNGAYGELGVNSNNDHDRPQQVHGLGNVGYLTGIATVVAGTNFSLAVGSDGSMYAWGQNGSGQLGVNSNNKHYYPQQVHGPGNAGYFSEVAAAAAGDQFSLALRSNGTVYAWGFNSTGQLGNDMGNVPWSYTPVQVRGLTDVVAIAAGDDFGLAVKNDGTVWAWGAGICGQLGVNSVNSHDAPVQVHGLANVGYLTGIVGVAAGQQHSLAVGSDGSMYSWGCNGHGQLGVHSNNNHLYPQQVHGLDNVGYLSDIADVAAGQFFSMALKNDGTAIYAWGGNSYNQIDASGNDRTYPVPVTGLPGALQEQTGPEGDGGCTMTPTRSTEGVWWLVVPAMALWWVRRRGGSKG